MSSTPASSDKYSVSLGTLGADLRIAPADSESGVSVVEHTLPPKTLGAPIHRHSQEDEISYVLEGELTVEADGERSTVPAGEFVVKGRDRWHTFWNAGEAPVRFLEIIAPGRFAGFFEAIAPLMSASPPDEETMRQMDEIGADYGFEFRWESVPELCERYGLRI